MKIFRNGLATGLLLQLAIGPVFFFIISITMYRTLLDGLAATVAVTLVDYLYITLAILGIGAVLERNRVKRIFGGLSSIVLVIFGFLMIKNVLSQTASTADISAASDILASFTSTFFLTISSPMTIVFWTSIFAAKAVECNYTRRELVMFGFSTGLATLLFMGTSVLLFSLIRDTVPPIVIRSLNALVGCLLIGYGGLRFARVVQNTK